MVCIIENIKFIIQSEKRDVGLGKDIYESRKN